MYILSIRAVVSQACECSSGLQEFHPIVPDRFPAEESLRVPSGSVLISARHSSGNTHTHTCRALSVYVWLSFHVCVCVCVCVSQLRSALHDVHQIFTVWPVRDRLTLLQQDREIRRERTLRDMVHTHTHTHTHIPEMQTGKGGGKRWDISQKSRLNLFSQNPML